jgi:sugar phosphate isomerase/epimerase
MNRVSVCLSVAAAVVLSLPVHADSLDRTGAKKLGWKLTLQSWTNNKHTVAESIDLCQQLGVHYLEVYPGQQLSPDDKGKFGPEMTDEQVKEVLDKAKSCNVKVIDYGVTGISGKEEEARKLFDWAKKVGLTTLVSEPDPKDLPAIDKLAGEYAIRVAIHDHPKPSRYWDPDYTYGLIKDLKNVGFCADVGHWKRSGLEPVEVLKQYGDRVFSLHFKDLVPGEGDHNLHDVPWGTGASRAADMLAVLKEKGFKGPIAIEYEWKWDVPTLQKCVEFFFAEANKLAAG